MLSVKNSGGGTGVSLKMEIKGMYYDTGSTTGKPMDMPRIYGYYNIVNEPKSFTIFDEYTPIDVEPTEG